MSKRKKKKFKKKFKAQMMQQMQSMQRETLEDKPEIKVSQAPIEETTKAKSKWDVPEEKLVNSDKIKTVVVNNDENKFVKTDLFKVGWVFGLTIVLLVTLIVINYQTTWLTSFADWIARFLHIVR